MCRQEKGFLPEPGNPAHADELLRLAAAINTAAASSGGFSVPAEDLDTHAKLVRRLALGARGQLSPVCALLGGVVGQEVLKAVSGKFTPIKQWFYYDGSDALPEVGV